MKYWWVLVGVLISIGFFAGSFLYLRERRAPNITSETGVNVEVHDLSETIVAVKDAGLLKRLEGHWKLAPNCSPPGRIPLELVITKSIIKRVLNPETVSTREFNSLYYGLYYDADLGTYRVMAVPDWGKPLVNNDAFVIIDELRFPDDPNLLEVKNYDTVGSDNKNVVWWVYRRQ